MSMQTFPLSLSQSDIFFEQLNAPDEPKYNIGGYMKLGQLDAERFCDAWRQLVDSEAAFGIRVTQTPEGPAQWVSPTRPNQLPIKSFVETSQALSWIQQRFLQPFDLYEQPLYACYLLAIGEGETREYWYVALCHHLMMDGVGFANMCRLLSEYYQVSARSGDSSTAEISNDDYGTSPAQWQQVVAQDLAYQQSDKYQRDKAWWQQQSLVTEPLLTPWYRAEHRAVKQAGSTPGNSFRRVIDVPQSLADEVDKLAKIQRVQPAQVYLAMLAIYASKVQTQQQVVIGLPLHNRRNRTERAMPGMFTSVSPLAIECSESLKVSELLHTLEGSQKALFRHQRLPLSDIRQTQSVSREQALYDIGFSFLPLDNTLTFDANQPPAEMIYLDNQHEPTPLLVTVWQSQRTDGEYRTSIQLDLRWAYFSQNEANLLADRLLTILHQLTERNDEGKLTDRRLRDVQPMADKEWQQVLRHALPNRPAATDDLLHEMFRRQAELTPDAIAVVFDETVLTYQTLDAQSDALAAALQQADINVGDVVGIKLARSERMLVSVLAVLKTGAAYVPLDPAYPEARLAQITDDCSPAIIITDDNYPGLLTEGLISPAPFIPATLCAHHLAYIIYTSGSTGVPKGVMIEHRQTAALLNWSHRYFSQTELTAVLFSTSLNFDLSVFEMLAPLTIGGRVVVVDSILSLLDSPLSGERNVTLINTVPSGIRALLDRQCLPANAVTINLAGEALMPDVVNRLLQQEHVRRVVNLYGPSEDTTYSTAKYYSSLNASLKPVQFVTIGQPVSGTQALIVDAQGKPVPMGCVGELLLSGHGVTRGYWNQPAMTAEKYVPLELNGQAARWYCTGDRARWRMAETGYELEFLGRQDDQVKIRGFRVEPGEIEAVLHQQTGVNSSRVLVEDDQLLVWIKPDAAVTESQEQQTLLASLKTCLADTFPGYMQPSGWTMLADWPLLPNGKLNKSALPRPVIQANQAALPLETETQQSLAELWRTVLAVELADANTSFIGADSHFFNLGGHSLSVVALVAQIQARFGLIVRYVDVFQKPRLSTQAAWIEQLIATDRQQEFDNRHAIELSDLEWPVMATPAQRQLWLAESTTLSGAEYNMPGVFRITGHFSPVLADKALVRIIRRHQALHTVFAEQDGVLQQRLRDVPGTVIQTVTLLEDRDAQITQLCQHPFDLSRDLMIRASVLPESNGDTTLVVVLHHIAADGWSVRLLIEEWQAFYRELMTDFSAGAESDPGSFHDVSMLNDSASAQASDVARVQYGHYARWLMEGTQQKQSDALAYWTEKLADVPAIHRLPLDRPRQTAGDVRVAAVHQSIDRSLQQQLEAFCQQHQLTPFMVFHTVACLVVARHSQHTDVVFGTPVANRHRHEWQAVMGLFVNTNVLRVNTGQSSIAALLAHVRTTCLDAQTWQALPFETVLEALAVPRVEHAAPLVQLLINQHPATQNTLAFEQCTVVPETEFLPPLKFDLEINIDTAGATTRLQWLFNEALFNQSTIQRLSDHWLQTLQRLLNADLNAPVSSLSPFSLDECDQLFHQFAGQSQSSPTDEHLANLFLAQAIKTPDQIALIQDDETLSFSALAQRAQRIALQLQPLVQRANNRSAINKIHDNSSIDGSPVIIGVCLPRSFDQVSAILGILISGAAWLPMDPDYPQERLNYMIEDSRMSGLFTEIAVNELNVPATCSLLQVEYLLAQPIPDSGEVLNLSGIQPEDAAYVLYTSGSTGAPKGVIGHHAGILNRLHWMWRCYPNTAQDVYCSKAAIGFGDAIWELFGGLLTGNPVVLAHQHQATDPSELTQLVIQHAVTRMAMVPSLLNVLLDFPSFQSQALAQLTHVSVSGEKLPEALIHRFLQLDTHCELLNLYGSSEVAADVTAMPVRQLKAGEFNSIGQPLDNMMCLVLSEQQTLCPAGHFGELYVAGPGVATGYLHRPDLTAERFISTDSLTATSLPEFEPYRKQFPIVFRTGDKVAWNDRGELLFAGRVDDQIKLRGFRIEPGEIEAVIQQLPGVKTCKVRLYQPDVESSSMSVISASLVAWLELAPGASFDVSVSEWRTVLGEHLPDFMIPACWVIVERWPLTPNGKIDKKALPAPDFSWLQSEFVAPETPLEETLQHLWSLVLGQDDMGVTHDFFHLGGHSLAAMQLVNQIRQYCQVEVSIRQLFEATTIRQQAKLIQQHSSQLRQESAQTVLPVNANQPPVLSIPQQRLWTVEQLSPGQNHYHVPVAIRIEGSFDVARAEQALKYLVALHEPLRSRFVLSSAVEHQATPQLMIDDIDVLSVAIETRPVTVLPDGEQLRQISSEAFDLATGPLLRCYWFEQASAEQGILLFVLHHIVTDGWSMGVLVEQFNQLYRSGDEAFALLNSQINHRYQDFASWQRARLHTEAMAQSLNWWQQQLSGCPTWHGIACRFGSEVGYDAEHQTEHHTMSGSLSQRIQTVSAAQSSSLRHCAQRLGVTPFMLLHGVLNWLLVHYSDHDEVLIGTPVANRESAEWSSLVGFFVNALVLRLPAITELSGSIADYFSVVKQANLDAQSHQQVPFDHLIEQLDLPRDASEHHHSPLIQIMLSMNTNQSAQLSLDGVATELMPVVMDSPFSLHVLADWQETLTLDWRWQPESFNQAMIERLAEGFNYLLHQLTEQPALMLSDWRLMDRQQTQSLLKETRAEQSVALPTLLHYFEHAFPGHGSAIAIVDGERQVSYRELDQRATNLAATLVNAGISKDIPVGLLAERSADLFIAMIGVIKARGVLLPLATGLPDARLHTMIEDCQPGLILADDASLHRAQQSGNVPVLTLTEALTGSVTFQAQSVFPEDLAWIIYTSGSTGQPKGVMIEHGGAANMFQGWVDRGDVHADSRVAQFAAISFDASMMEWMSALLAGATLVICPDSVRQHPAALADWLVDHQISNITLPPSLLALLPQRSDYQLDTLITAGEAITSEVADVWRHQYRLFNAYGPSEISVCASYGRLHPEELVHIGTLMPNTAGYVVTPQGQLAPRGTIGELYLAGPGVARGYLNRSSETAAKFMANPFLTVDDDVSDHKLQRVYRTGDKVRWLENGTLEYLGRVDNQVKLRGFRIEPGEIEQVINQHQSVVTTKVLSVEQQLVCWFQLSDGASVSETAQALALLTEHHLPDYMQPASWVHVERWPLTINGKIDSTALISMINSQRIDLQGSEKYAPLSSDTETALAECWQQVLGHTHADLQENPLSQLHKHSHFFRAGGHSLLAIQLANLISQQFSVSFTPQDIFTAPTLVEMAGEIEQRTSASVVWQKAPVQPHYPLSWAQQRVWFIDQLNSNSAEYHMPMLLKVTGHCDLTRLAHAVNAVIAVQPALRTIYRDTDAGESIQQVLDTGELIIRQHRLDVDEIEALTALTNRLVSQPFDLKTEIPIQCHWITSSQSNSDGSGYLLVILHHIAADGWSVNVLMTQINKALAGESLTPNSRQYIDYAWQQHQQTQDAAIDYWQQHLAGVPLTHSLPLDFSRPAQKQTVGNRVLTHFTPEQKHRLIALAQHADVTLYMMLQAVLGQIISWHSNSHDIVIGTPAANRPHKAFESVIGFFVNTLVIRLNTDQGSLKDYLNAVKQENLAAQQHQNLPFEKLVEVCKVPGSLQYSPLFQIMFVMNPSISTTLSLDGCSLDTLPLITPAAKFDLEITATEQADDSLTIDWLYDVSLFSQEHITALSRHLSQALVALSELTTLDNVTTNGWLQQAVTDDEWQRVWLQNDRWTDYAREILIHELIEQQVEATPDALAVCVEHETRTYQQLNREANQLAHLLRAKGVTAGKPVGLCLPRSCELMVSLLAILKAGGAYVPMDPAYPQQRLDYMAEMSDAALTITPEWLMEQASEIAQQAYENPLPAGDETQLAYMIFTSGSTGKPKGTLIPHHTVVNLLQWYVQEYDFTSNDRFLVFSATGFDLTQKNLLAPLTCGASIHFATAQEYDPQQILKVIEKQQITVTNCAPGGFYPILTFASDQDYTSLNSLRWVLLGGEAIDYGRFTDWLAGSKARLVNMYGPTECTDISNSYIIKADHKSGQAVPIGPAMANVTLYVAQPCTASRSEFLLVPPGSLGELCIGGAGVTPGYLKNERLTAEKFVDDPFFDQYPARAREILHCAARKVYRTGDLVRWNDQNELVFCGRIDHQIKLRGLRIEPGEIEIQIQAYSGVVRASVITEDEQLLAFFTVTDDKAININALKAHLQQQLPDWMVPGRLYQLSQIPLTPNGKVDRNALINHAKNTDADGMGKHYVAPVSSVARQLQLIWANVLHRQPEDISCDTNFFELGGHSLLMTQVVHQALNDHQLPLAVKDIFIAPTVNELADRLIDRLSDNDTSLRENMISYQLVPGKRIDESVRYPLSVAQMRLWLTELLTGEERGKQQVIQLGVTLKTCDNASLNPERLQQVFQQLIQETPSLRTGFVQAEQQPWQVIHSLQNCPNMLAIADQSVLSDVEQHGIIKRWQQLPFDITQPPLVRGLLLKTGDNQWRLVCRFHHLICDGWSLAVFYQRLFQLYFASESSVCQADAVNYLDYCDWQQAFLASDEADYQRGFWRDYLAGCSGWLRLPFEYDDNQAIESIDKNSKSDTNFAVSLSLSESDKQVIQTAAKRQQASLFHVLYTAFSVLVARLTEKNDITIGIPVSGRHLAGASELVGLLLNNLPVRTQIDISLSSGALITQQAANINNVLVHQDLPFEEILNQARIERTSSNSDKNQPDTPLFQLFFNVLNLPQPDEQLFTDQNFSYVMDDVPEDDHKFTLSMYVADQTDGLLIFINYNKDKLPRTAVEGFIFQYKQLLMAMVSDLNQPVNQLSLVPDIADFTSGSGLHQVQGDPEDSSQVDQDYTYWPDPCKPLPKAPVFKAIHDYVSHWASDKSTDIAVCSAGLSLNWRELDELTTNFAKNLIKHGVKIASPVGILAERRPELLIATLSVLKAGGAFMMLSSDVPEARIQQQFSVVTPDLVITLGKADRSESELLRGLRAKFLEVNVLDLTLEHVSTRNTDLTEQDLNNIQLPTVFGESPACITFTSGTTGVPKAIVGRHSALTSFMPWMAKTFDLSDQDTFSLLSGLVHDPLQRDMFTPVWLGATLVVPTEEQMSATQLAPWLLQHGVSVLHLTPALGAQLTMALELDSSLTLPALRLGFFVGEALTQTHINKFNQLAPAMQVVNLYGSTETSRAVSYYPVTAEDTHWRVMPVGRGMFGSELLVLNRAMKLCGPYEPGQLAIRSRELALGYVDNQSLTDAVFIRNPETNDPTDRWYLTGDLGHFLPDGNVMHQGRSDQQVKIRGFRVELADIEATLTAQPGVEFAAVIADRTSDDIRLLAFVQMTDAQITESENGNSSETDLMHQLRSLLPGYMVPAGLRILPAMPLTANRKIDRKQLHALAPEHPTEAAVTEQSTVAAPETELERELTAIWQEVLPEQTISVTSDFFSLGGHSLLATKLLVRIYQLCGVEISYPQFFQHSSVRAVAHLVEQHRDKQAQKQRVLQQTSKKKNTISL